MRFKDKVVVVTGGASGIGFATARMFAAEGAIVAINDSDAARAKDAVGRISGSGRQVFSVVGDVSNYAAVRDNVRSVLERYRRIDILVNNAGINQFGGAADISESSWNRTVSVNLNGVFFWAQAVAVESMIPSRSGIVINVASMAGLVGCPNMAAYVATKHAVVGLTKALAIEWGPVGIRVNALCPGLTETPMVVALRQDQPAVFEERQRRIPLGRPASPQEQAAAILFMASSEAGSVHGLIMNVDGGQTIMSSGYAVPRPAEDN